MNIDLTDKESLPALRALRKSPWLQRNVHTAHINAASCVWYGPIKMDIHALIEVFLSLGELPRLSTVTLDLSNLQVPVAALTALLRGATFLRELQLTNIQLVGPIEALEEALQAHTHLSRVRFIRCQGHAIQSFMTELPSLKKLELRYTAIGVIANNDKNPWVRLGQSTQLQSLTVQEVRELKSEHIVAFADSLLAQHVQGTCNLQELHLSSTTGCVNGQQCASAVADLVIIHPRSTIKTLTLKFGQTWKTAGATTASLLRKTPSIASLCVQLTGKDIAVQGQEIFDALTFNTTLKRLKICLDQDQYLDGPIDQSFMDALEHLLVTNNHVLQSVGVLDENREKYSLPAVIRHKLELNASGLPKLLHNGHFSCDLSTQDYIDAMIDYKDSLDAVFYALSNHPELLLDLSPSAMALLSSETTTVNENGNERDLTVHASGDKDKPRRQSATSRIRKFLHV